VYRVHRLRLMILVISDNHNTYKDVAAIQTVLESFRTHFSMTLAPKNMHDAVSEFTSLLLSV